MFNLFNLFNLFMGPHKNEVKHFKQIKHVEKRHKCQAIIYNIYIYH